MQACDRTRHWFPEQKSQQDENKQPPKWRRHKFFVAVTVAVHLWGSHMPSCWLLWSQLLKDATKQAGLVSPSIKQNSIFQAQSNSCTKRTGSTCCSMLGASRTHHSALCQHIEQNIGLVQFEASHALKVCWLSGNRAAGKQALLSAIDVWR